MNWSILGIEPTKDKKAITAAYRQRLRTTNPEDKPEEFKALRAAYEEALALADKQDAPQPADDTPVGRWIAKVESVYGDLSARINSDIWRGLLSDGVCVGLDTRLEAEDALLKVLMKSYYLPKAVWQLIEETFHFAERLEELKERYPANFLETVICGGLKWDPSLPFELFIPGKNGEVCDRYISLYMEASQLLCGQRGELLEQLGALSERHPYGDVMRFRESVANGDREAGTEGLRQLTVEYPDDSHILVSLASVFVEEEKVEEAEALCLRALQAAPGCAPAKMFLSRCKSQQGAYDEAKELLIELLRECGGDPIVMEYYMKQLKELNEQLIPQREARMAEEPEDVDNLLELAWCYFQNGREADAVEIAGRLSADCEDAYKYHNLMGKLQFNQLNYAEALEHLQLLEAVIRQLPDDGTAETRKRRERLPEVIQLQGTCLMQMVENAQAREKLKEALALAPDDLDNIQIMGKVLYAAGEHEYAVEILERANALSPSNWHINLLKALSLFRLYRDRDAYDAISIGISSQVKDMSLYLIKLQILLRNQVWDEVHETLEMLEASGVEDDLSLDFVKAQLTELEQKNEKAAFAQYQKIARRVEAGENILWGSILYYRMACLMSESMDMDREEDRELLMAMLDKGLAQYAHDADCLRFKAWVMQRGGKIREAVELYRGILAGNKRSEYARQGLSNLYFTNLDTCAQEALSWYEELLSERQTPELLFYAAHCKWHLGDFEGARRLFVMEQELDPDDEDAYNGLAYLCDAVGEYEESLKYLQQATEAAARGDRLPPWICKHRVQVLRRIGKMEEALSAVDELEQVDASEMYALKFEICCQFGQWKRAAAVLKAWKKALPKDSEWVKSKGKLFMFQGKVFRANIAMSLMGKNLSPKEIEEFQMQTQELIGAYDFTIKVLRNRVKSDPRDDHMLLKLASTLQWSGKKKETAKYAQMALERLNEILCGNLTDEALYRCRRSKALALLGRVDEARQELETARKLPLCDYCPYSSCKDADIFEAEIEELQGNREKALALFEEGKNKWPDDTDFIAGEGRLNRKGT